MDKKSYILGFIYAILSACAFGVMPILAKYAYSYGSNATTTLFFRFLIAFLFLAVYLVVLKINIKVNFKQFCILFITGFLTYTLTTQTLFLSYVYLGAGLATTLHFIYPVFVGIFAFLILRQELSRIKILALIFGISALFSFVIFDSHQLNKYGVFLAVFSGLIYSFEIIALSLQSLKNLDNKVVLFYILLSSTLGFLTYGSIKNELIFNFNIQLIFIYLGISILCTIMAILWFLKALPLIGATATSILGTFEFIVSIILGIILFDEELSLGLCIGSALIIVSVVLLAFEKNIKKIK